MEYKDITLKTLIAIIIGLFLFTPCFAQDVKDVTLKQLIQERPDLVEKIKAGEDENTSEITVTKDLKGRTKIWTEITKDIDGNQIQKRIDTYTYYQTGEIDTINQKVYGADDTIVKEQNVKHYMDGKQPMVTKVEQQIEGG
uniref:Uncharacterized protein n=1 Tax=viral metagenome TaxID=1070528 RepID=A0A6M3LS98_9ZZZZ